MGPPAGPLVPLDPGWRPGSACGVRVMHSSLEPKWILSATANKRSGKLGTSRVGTSRYETDTYHLD